MLIRAYVDAGRRSQALCLIDELKRRQQSGNVPTAAFVNAFLGLGDNE
jgi:pentatricopeptide repeat protein